MQPFNNIAFKEWAVVCAALAAGRQSIILRKGGIDEGREGFRVKHNEFWLLPTRYHQDSSQLVPEAEPLWRHIESQMPASGFRIDLHAVVKEVFELTDLAAAQRLAPLHILSAKTVEQRFRYRRPGLFVLAVRIYHVPVPFDIDDSQNIAGCKSWVELDEARSTAQAVPVVEDEEFAKRWHTILELQRTIKTTRKQS
jgi:hypothetical protein